MCTTVSIILKHLGSPIRYLRLSHRQQLSASCHHFVTKTKYFVPGPVGRGLQKAVKPKSTFRRRAIHDGKTVGSELDTNSNPRATSFTMNSMDEQNRGQITRGQDATKHRAMIALGSNIGDRVDMIEQACERMRAQGIIVQRTSLLYETAPMYVTDQDTFYNGVCEVRSCGLPNLNGS